MTSVPCIDYLLAFICILYFSGTLANNTFRLEKLNSDETIISYMMNGQETARVAIRKAPLLNFYILHTLYVLPEHRNCGIGKNLLEYACNYVKTQGARRIYIQPGPFELDENGYLVKPTELYQERMDKLIALYKKCGFSAASTPLTYCAYLLYKCLHIDENSAHLMVKCFVD